jgi:gliding motility-associatede transport system auxiliary component
MEKKQRAATLSGAVILVIAVAMVLVNVIFYAANARLDMTKNERFTLSKGSANLVSTGLNESMSVTLYVTRGLPKTDLFVDDLVNLMNEYESASNGKMTYTLVEPKTDEQRQEAKEAGLQEAAFGEGSETGDQATITRGYMGIVFEYGSEKEVIPMLSPDQSQGLEFWITNKIREIRDRADDIYAKVGVITKEGIKLSDANLTPPQGGRPGPNIKGILQQALPFYKIEDVDLQAGDAAIDEEFRGVIMMQADEDWTDKELARVDEFLMKGDKSLLVIAGAVNMKSADATMKATLSTRGLEKLVGPYGIEMQKGAILDWSSQMRIPVQNQVGSLEWISAPGVLQIQHEDGEEEAQMLDNRFAGFFRLEELSFPYASPLVAHPEAQPEAKVTVVARTTESATVDQSEAIDLSLTNEAKPTGEQAQRAIAINVEGVLKSAMTGKVEGITIPEKSASPSRVLVISSPQFLANPFARAGNPPPMPPQMAMMGAMGGDRNLQAIAVPYARQYLTATILAFKNLMDWMSGDQDLLAVSAKLLGDPNLSYTDVPKPKITAEDSEESAAKKLEEYKSGRKSLQNRVQWSLTLFPSLLFAAFGFFRWRSRESNRDKVKL